MSKVRDEFVDSTLEFGGSISNAMAYFAVNPKQRKVKVYSKRKKKWFANTNPETGEYTHEIFYEHPEFNPHTKNHSSQNTDANDELSHQPSQSSNASSKPYTSNAINLLRTMEHITQQSHSHFAGTEHLLLAILNDDSNQAKRYLTTSNLDLATIAHRLFQEFVNVLSGAGGDASYFDSRSPSLHRSLWLANCSWKIATSRLRYRNYLSSEFLLFGMLLSKIKDGKQNAACKCLEEGGNTRKATTKGNTKSNTKSNTKGATNACVTVDVAVLAQGLFRFLKLDQQDMSFATFVELLPSSKEMSEKKYGFTWGKSIVKNNTPITCTSLPTNSITHARTSDFVNGTHWIYPGKLLCGQSAGRFNRTQLKSMVHDLNVNVFVCLQTTYNEYGCNDYRQTLQEIDCRTVSGDEIRFLHCPVPDFGVVSGSSLVALVSELRKTMNETGSVMYVHCMGGHGRTGTVMTALIASVEGLNAKDALNSFKRKHTARGCGSNCLHDGLEAMEQNEQIVKVQAAMGRVHRLNDK